MKKTFIKIILMIPVSLAVPFLGCTKKTCEAEVVDYFMVKNETGQDLELDITSRMYGPVTVNVSASDKAVQMIGSGARTETREPSPGKLTPNWGGSPDCSSRLSEDTIKIQKINAVDAPAMKFTVCTYDGQQENFQVLIKSGAGQTCPHWMIPIRLKKNI